MTVWSIPPEWIGETAFLLGGGPSLSGFDAEILRGHGRVIAINEAGLTVAPWADVLFFPDPRWLEWNIDRFHLFEGDRWITRQDPEKRTPGCDPKLAAHIEATIADFDINVIARETVAPISFDPMKVAGVCGGGNAINLAFLFGSPRIILLGYDMKPNGHFHDRHKKNTTPGNYDRFRRAITLMSVHLRNKGVEVLNATPESGLACFPFADIREFI